MKRANSYFPVLRGVLPLLILLPVFSQSGGHFDLSWNTVDAGGAGVSGASTGGRYTLSGTIGQPDARNQPEPMTGGRYAMTGGFWVIPEYLSVIAGRHVFYNNSYFDGDDPAANPNDDNAVATDKVAVLPGQMATLNRSSSRTIEPNAVDAMLYGVTAEVW